MDTVTLVGKRVKVFQGDVLEGIAEILNTYEIIKEVDGSYTAYCLVNFDNDADGDNWFRWINSNYLVNSRPMINDKPKVINAKMVLEDKND